MNADDYRPLIQVGFELKSKKLTPQSKKIRCRIAKWAKTEIKITGIPVINMMGTPMPQIQMALGLINNKLAGFLQMSASRRYFSLKNSRYGLLFCVKDDPSGIRRTDKAVPRSLARKTVCTV